MSLTSFINERLQINKDYAEPYVDHPKDKHELIEILKKRFEGQQESSEKNPINLNDIDVSNVQDLSSAFYYTDYYYANYGKIKYIDISNWNVSNVLDFSNMFNECSSIHYIGDLSNWDVSSGTNFYNMFNGCKMLKNIGDLSNWKMTNANDIHSMFSGCKRLENIGDAGRWDVSNVRNFNFIFKGCEKLKPINLNNWKIHNDVTGQNIRMIISGTSGWKMPDWFFDVRKR
jgi:surface protein